MTNVRVRVNPDNVNQWIMDSQDNTATPFVEATTGKRWGDAATVAWQEFLLAIPAATRNFKIGDVVNTDLSGVTANAVYIIRLGSSWFRITTGAAAGSDSSVSAAGYVFMGNIQTLKPS